MLWRKLAELVIRGYQLVFGGLIHLLAGPGAGCRFEPTCSEYLRQATHVRSPGDALGLGMRRLLRCHPWSRGGYDPVPERKSG